MYYKNYQDPKGYVLIVCGNYCIVHGFFFTFIKFNWLTFWLQLIYTPYI